MHTSFFVVVFHEKKYERRKKNVYCERSDVEIEGKVSFKLFFVFFSCGSLFFFRYDYFIDSTVFASY